ncbi:lipid A biosynthesis acyltransferase [Viridibacterium curvum]|uniref:Lipid A biosynthesis lauroyl acyltransferase n=1 Tax=Viridibacterium curvum TaxID=1101404 RepID=A0ABP9QL32_9RHOO
MIRSVLRSLPTAILAPLIWLLHWLPLPVQAAVGWVLGHLLYLLVAPRRRVVHTNLRLCFPELSDAERGRLARRNVVAVVRSMLERGVIWWGSEARIRRLVEVRGLEHMHKLHEEGRNMILLVPHFVGLDVAGARLTMELDGVGIYSAQLDKLLERLLMRGRLRFGNQMLLSRQEGIRGAVRAMKTGRPFFYLPDLDYGPKESVFVPFFGVQTATIPGLSRVARLADAAVIPVVTLMKPWGTGYVCTLSAPWTDFPSDDAVADTARMNAWIESEVRQRPAEYYWVHKRFKTRPPGEAKLY